MTEVRKLRLDGLFEIVPKKFGDDRGFFSEVYNASDLAKDGIDMVFVQDNHALSVAKGVLRGLHYQLPPYAQGKLIRVVHGAILDVAVDIRRSSPNFGRWLALEISAARWNQVLVPPGFAHGYLTLVEDTEVVYKVTARYSPQHERSIRFDDPAIGIEWGDADGAFVLSDKDRAAPLLNDAEVFP